MTAVSTVLAPILTPLLAQLYAGQRVDVNPVNMLDVYKRQVQGPYLCAKMLLFSAWENRYTTATESNRRTAKTAVLRNRYITGKGEVHYGTSI